MGEDTELGEISMMLTFNQAGDGFTGTIQNIHFDGMILGSLSNWETYDVEANGIPKFIESEFIELDKIYDITKFRSGVGPDSSDDFESCRNMRHFYGPKRDIDWTSVEIFAPVAGKIVFLNVEQNGTTIIIQPEAYPAFNVAIFTVNPGPFTLMETVSAGQKLGNHNTSESTSGIEIGVRTPQGYKLISYFDLLPDELFQPYADRGVIHPNVLIISKDARDADPLTCTDGYIDDPGNIENVVVLD